MPAVTLYRLRSGRHIEAYVRQAASEPERVVRTDESALALWRGRSEPEGPPEWATIVQEAFDDQRFETPAGRESALVVVQTDVDGVTATWALSFGHGARHWLDPSAIDRDGHILAAVGVMRDPVSHGLTTLTAVSAQEISLQNQRIAREIPTGASMSGFEYDRDVQVLRGASGRPRVTGVGNTVAGGESVHLTGVQDFAGCGLAIAILERTVRHAREGGDGEIPGPRPVRDRALTLELDQQLVNDILAGSGEIAIALPPDALDARVFFSKLGRSAAATAHRTTGVEAPEIGTYVNVLRATGAIASFDVEALHEVKIETCDDSGGPWPLYDLLSGRVTHNDAAYVVEDGQWYRAPRDFVESLNLRVDECPHIDDYLAYSHADEAAYNTQLATKLKLAGVLDRQLVRGDGFSSSIEMADVVRLVREDGRDIVELLHVKRGFVASKLSHLYNQASTVVFSLPERSVRRGLFERIEATSLSAATKRRIERVLAIEGVYDPARIRIVLGIIGPWNGRLPSVVIPVLARAGLQRAIQRASSRGHQIRIARIPLGAGTAIAGAA